MSHIMVGRIVQKCARVCENSFRLWRWCARVRDGLSCLFPRALVAFLHQPRRWMQSIGISLSRLSGPRPTAITDSLCFAACPRSRALRLEA